ncbi:MAG: NAD(P)H-dependent oxidoreductase [Proteobacteria bacterium]|nr:NAD(P)H-dependent oxidoreductase [Pseudomonadota bacterium]
MTTLIGLSGSLRRGSFNTALLRAAATLLPADATLEIRTLHDIPLYDGDLEASAGAPPAVAALKEAIVAADGLLLGTPEYNNGIPGVFKNGIDWLSRPASDIKRVFGDKPVALIGASTGPFGTILSQAAWLPVLRVLGARYWSGSRLLVSRSAQVFDEAGTLQDEKLREQLKGFLAGFVSYVRESLARNPPGSSQTR